MNKMNITALSIVLLSMSPTAFAAQGRTPPGSYLRTPVHSVDELAAEIGKDKVVQRQFAKHFGVPPGQLQTYIRDNVMITRVTSTTPRSVYVIRRNGQMVAQRTTLKRGAPIFALRDTGEPLLVLKCGNPVLKKLPPREKVKPSPPQVYQLLTPAEAPLPPAVVEAPPLQVPPVPPPTVGLVAGAAAPVSVPPPVPVAHRGIIPILPFFGINHHHGKPPVPPPPIPEPGGAAAVAATALLPAAGWAVRKLRYRTTKIENA